MRPAPQFLLACAVAFVAIGCDSKASHGPPAPALVASNVAAALGVDADLPPQPDPTPAAGDLASDVAAFTTLDDCVGAHSTKIDPLIGDALLSFGYDTFVRDACRQIDAVKSRDPKKCDAIVASALASHCRETIAMVAGKPDDCPFSSSGEEAGRLPTCVAVASRDPRLCSVEPIEGWVECEAIVMRDPYQCRDIPKTDIAACRRTGERLRSSLAPARTDLPALPTAKGKLVLHALEGTQAPSPEAVDLALTASEGVALRIGTLETRFIFGETVSTSAFPHAVVPDARLKIGFELQIPNGPHGDAHLRNVTLDVPGGVRLDDSRMHEAPKIKIVQLGKERGAAVEFTIDGEIGSAPQGFTFHVEVKTFARDVVK